MLLACLAVNNATYLMGIICMNKGILHIKVNWVYPFGGQALLVGYKARELKSLARLEVFRCHGFVATGTIVDIPLAVFIEVGSEIFDASCFALYDAMFTSFWRAFISHAWASLTPQVPFPWQCIQCQFRHQWLWSMKIKLWCKLQRS